MPSADQLLNNLQNFKTKKVNYRSNVESSRILPMKE